jgi:hypothetical protein
MMPVLDEAAIAQLQQQVGFDPQFQELMQNPQVIAQLL